MMKRLLAILLTSCMIAGIASPAGAGLKTEIKANTEAALSNMNAASGNADTAEGTAGSFDQAIRDLYDNSMSATDEEVLASAQKMDSDFEAVEKTLGSDAGDLIDCLKYYEAAKSSYIAGERGENTKFSGSILDEWDRQEKYTSYVMPAEDTVQTMVPRIKVTGCDLEDKTATLHIYEWMTVGYASFGSEEVNATAYGYNFSLQADRDRRGNWVVASVDDTEQNFDWMQEEAEYAAQAEQSDDDGLRVLSEDGEQEMMAAVAANTYTYKVSAAIAYADKYCINYNPSYNSYKGRGGDCANFVSQCLYAGGFKQDSVWYRHSVAWINVMKQIAHFKFYGTFLNANNGNLIKGNPIYFDWNGDGIYDHATICVGRNKNGVAILDSHTRDLYHATWTNWNFKKAGTIQLRSSGTTASTTQSGGFKTDSKGKYYQNSDGSRIKNCFYKIDGKTYYFDSNGYVAKGIKNIKGKTYLFNTSSGVMCTGWITYKGNKYYLGTDGVAYTEWNEIGGHYYYFDPTTCVMATGFYRVKTKLHYFESNGVEQFGWITVAGKKYYLDEYGVVQFGWQNIGAKKYYFDENGAMVTGNVKIEGVVYTFDQNGVCKGKAPAGTTAVEPKKTSEDKTKTSTSKTTKTTKPSAPKKTGKTGWVSKNGKWYYYKNGDLLKGCWLKFKKDNSRNFYLSKYGGAMLTGWKTIKGSRYYFDSNGVMKRGWFKYKSSWYYLQKNGKMKTGWLKIGTRYFYLQRNGKMKTGWHYDEDGNTYYLNKEGVMVTGKQIIDGRIYYFNNSGAKVN